MAELPTALTTDIANTDICPETGELCVSVATRNLLAVLDAIAKTWLPEAGEYRAEWLRMGQMVLESERSFVCSGRTEDVCNLTELDTRTTAQPLEDFYTIIRTTETS